jgi:MFS family permease
MPITLLLDEALRQTRAHFRAIFPAVGLPVALITTVFAVFQAFSIQSLMTGGNPMTMMWSPQILLSAVALGIFAALAYVAGQVAALDALAGRPVDMKRAWAFAVRPAVWGTCLLSGLIIIISFVLCILPVFYVAPLLSFVVPAMVEEGRFGWKALARSAELARFNPSGGLQESPIVKLLLLMLVTTLLSYVAGIVVALPFQLPMFIDLFRKAMSGQEDVTGVMARWVWLQIPAQFLSALARMAIYIYSAFGTALLYSDVRGRKEGIDLRPEIDALFPASVAPPAPGEPWS